MMVKPFVGKAKVKDTYSGYKIEIPAPRNWFVIIFMTAWLGGWAMGWMFAFTTIISEIRAPMGVDLFLLFWLTGWTVGGFFAIKTLYWMILGKEIITIQNGKLQIERRGDILGKSKIYDLGAAENFQVRTTPQFSFFHQNRENSPFMMNKLGTIQFDYGLKTIRFGIGIDEAEGRFLLDKFKSKELIAA